MSRLIIGATVALALLVAGTTAFAQGVITTIKTPPMQASDLYFLPLDMHPGAPNPGYAGWAGSRMEMHIADAGEMDVLGLTPVASGPGTRGPTGIGTPTGPTIIDPFGPASGNLQSVVQTYFAFHPAASASGINVQPSVNLPIFDLTIHAKNSDPIGNSDIDATFRFWNIWHLRGGTGGSTFVTLEPSDYILVRSSIQDPQQLHTQQSFYQFPTNPAHPGEEGVHWLHLFEPYIFHLVPGPGSQFYATFANTAFFGVDHVPEPTSFVLLSAGALCAVVGAWQRRRRRKLAAA